MRVSFKDNFVFTAGEDGALIVYENKDKDYLVRIDNESVETVTEEFLIPHESYLEQRKEIDKLKKTLAEERMKQEQQVKEKMRIRDNKIAELERVQNDNETRDKMRYLALDKEKKTMVDSYEERKRLMKLQHENNKRVGEEGRRRKGERRRSTIMLLLLPRPLRTNTRRRSR